MSTIVLLLSRTTNPIGVGRVRPGVRHYKHQKAEAYELLPANSCLSPSAPPNPSPDRKFPHQGLPKTPVRNMRPPRLTLISRSATTCSRKRHRRRPANQSNAPK